MKKIVIVLLLLITIGVNSKNKHADKISPIKIVSILDAETKEALSGVRFKTKSGKGFSDLDGKIKINNHQVDSLDLSFVSYRKITIVVNDSTNIIYLKKI